MQYKSVSDIRDDMYEALKNSGKMNAEWVNIAIEDHK